MGTTGTSGTSAKTAGYRLSGADVRNFVGQRVQVVGTVSPSASASADVAANADAAASSASPSSMPEFRVVSIRPIGGSCSQ